MSAVAPGAWDICIILLPELCLSLTRKVFPLTQDRTGLISTTGAPKTKRPPQNIKSWPYIETEMTQNLSVYSASDVKYGNLNYLNPIKSLPTQWSSVIPIEMYECVFPFTPDTLTDTQREEAFYPLHSCVDIKCTPVINGASLLLNLIAWTRHFNLSALIFYLKCYTNGNKKHEEREVNTTE